MRILMALLLFLPGAAAAAEWNTDRPGQDYHSFDIQADPGICESACTGDSRCRAWTYVVPGVQGPSARCWLKHSVPTAMASDCCVSGTKEPLRHTGTFRSRWDAIGGPITGWTTGWVPGVPRQVCGHYAAGCNGCGGADYCGEHGNGATVGWWPDGKCGPHQTVLRCTSEPE